MIGTVAILVVGAFVLPNAWVAGAQRRKSVRLIAELSPECGCRRCSRIRAGITDPTLYGPHPGPSSEWAGVHFKRPSAPSAELMRETGGASRYDRAAARLVARTGRHPTNGEVIAEVEREAAGLAPVPGKPLNLFPVARRKRIGNGRTPAYDWQPGDTDADGKPIPPPTEYGP